jgi:hypothetical protein
MVTHTGTATTGKRYHGLVNSLRRIAVKCVKNIQNLKPGERELLKKSMLKRSGT